MLEFLEGQVTAVAGGGGALPEPFQLHHPAFYTSVYGHPFPRLSVDIGWAAPRRTSPHALVHACGSCPGQEGREARACRPRAVSRPEPHFRASSGCLGLPGKPLIPSPASCLLACVRGGGSFRGIRRHLGHFPTISASKRWAAVNFLPSLSYTDARFWGQLVVTRQRSKYLGQPGWSVPPILGLVRP